MCCLKIKSGAMPLFIFYEIWDQLPCRPEFSMLNLPLKIFRRCISVHGRHFEIKYAAGWILKFPVKVSRRHAQ